jgi:REP element-mobilizing transposase RayT
MARPLRVEYPGAFYHVISRGNAGCAVFKTRRDRERFLSNLNGAHDQYALVIHAYCLMDNHYHLLVETPEANLSQALQWLNVSYAAYFNRRHDRIGHLFQGRFRAILIEADEYLIPLSRYIHLNPVKAKLVGTPDAYAWSSYGAVVGKADCPGFLNRDDILSRFGDHPREAVARYRRYVEGMDIERLEDPLRNATGSFVLGDDDFVRWVRGSFLQDRKDHREVPQLRRLEPRVDLDRIVDAVGREYNCPAERIRAGGGKNNRPRDASIFLARKMSGLSCCELGGYFGGVSGASITMTVKRVAVQLAKDEDLAKEMESARKRIFNI